MRKIILSLLMIAAIGQGAAAGSGDYTINRRGRSIQPDGLLLEWAPSRARPWHETGWKWDAIATPQGIAVAVWATPSPACSAWIFAISPNAEALASDAELGTTEWVLSGVANTDKITITANSYCGDILPPLVLTVDIPDEGQQPPVLLYTLIIMVLAGVLTWVMAARRRKKAVPTA